MYSDGLLLLQAERWQHYDFTEKVAAISGDVNADCDLAR